jgi:hypothetical protein
MLRHGKPSWRLAKKISVTKLKSGGSRVMCIWPELTNSTVHTFELPRDEMMVKPLGEKTMITKFVTLDDGIYSVIAYDSIKKKHMVERKSDKR